MTTIQIAGSTVPAILRATRGASGFSTRAIAALIGVSHTTVSSWERGAGEPTVTQFARWADATGQDVAALLSALDYRSEG